MRSRFSKACLIAATAGALLVPAFFAPAVDAQKQGAMLWYKVDTVKRVEKPDRKPLKPLSKTPERVALLTLQWRLFERGDKNIPLEADPNRIFHNADQLKLAVTTNQDGYLYVIQRMNNGDGRLVFPDPRSNEGRNNVKKNQEYIVPSYCPAFPVANDCWWEMAPPTGRESFIIVFSRDQFDKLPKRVALDNDGDYEYPIVNRGLVEDLVQTFRDNKPREAKGRLAVPGKQAARFATRLQNTNLKDNEELIGLLELKHGD